MLIDKFVNVKIVFIYITKFSHTIVIGRMDIRRAAVRATGVVQVPVSMSI